MPRECECGDNCPLCEGCGKPQCECVCDEGLFTEEDSDPLENPGEDEGGEGSENDDDLNNNGW